MTDLIERLRSVPKVWAGHVMHEDGIVPADGRIVHEAAEEIERLRAAVQHEADCVEAAKAEIERLTADRSRLLNAARRAVTALAAAAERTPEFQRDYEMLAGSLAPFRGEWPKEQR